MLRQFEPTEDICVDVFLLSGQSFIGCDVAPTNDHQEGFYAFWWCDKLLIYRLDLIEHIAYYNKNKV